MQPPTPPDVSYLESGFALSLVMPMTSRRASLVRRLLRNFHLDMHAYSFPMFPKPACS
jgi:hypothetical protein